MEEKGKAGHPDVETGCCGGRAAGELYVTDLLARPIDIPRVTAEATIAGPTRGQNVEKCPTDPLPLHANLTVAVVNVSGDLKIDPKSCKVQITWAAGAGGGFVFEPGVDVGITVPLAAGVVLTGNCVKTEKVKLCKWSFTRTSP